MGGFVYVREFVEAEDGEGDGGEEYEEGHACGCGCGGSVGFLWLRLWYRFVVLVSVVVASSGMF